MENKLATALHSVQPEARRYIFCYIDLDRFKLVNDTCGQRAGDALLERLTAIMARRVEGETTPWRDWAATSSACCSSMPPCRRRSTTSRACATKLAAFVSSGTTRCSGWT
jgi:hypothetical protein